MDGTADEVEGDGGSDLQEIMLLRIFIHWQVMGMTLDSHRPGNGLCPI